MRLWQPFWGESQNGMKGLCLLSSPAKIIWTPKYSAVLSQKTVSAYYTSEQIVPFGFAEQYSSQLSGMVCRYFRCLYGEQYLHYSDLIGADERAWRWRVQYGFQPGGWCLPNADSMLDQRLWRWHSIGSALNGLELDLALVWKPRKQSLKRDPFPGVIRFLPC